MHPAGLKAFAARKRKKSGIYSYEQRKSAEFTREQEKQFRANNAAWISSALKLAWYQEADNLLGISARNPSGHCLRETASLVHE